MNKLIKIAEQYLGANVDVKKSLLEYYNRYCLPLVKQERKYKMGLDDNWCAMFASVVAHKAGYTPNQFPYEVSVYYQCEIARQWGAFHNGLEGAYEGDLIVYDWLNNGGYDHIGIIKTLGERHIVTVEGNYSNTVKRRMLNRSSSSIKGFIRLSGVEHSNEYETLEALVKGVLRGDYGDGAKRKRLLGDKYNRVQEMINEILK